MSFAWEFKNLLRRLSGRQSLEEERFNRLMSIRMDLDKFDTVDDPMYKLINDFTLGSITVSKSDGSVLLGNGNSRIESVKGSALLDYIKSEVPSANYVMIKTRSGARVIYSDGEYIYIVRASGYVSPLEMKLISQKTKSEMYGG